jgi:ABC-type dipeptide/oligopeptide/nickel transport system ATPase subunit
MKLLSAEDLSYSIPQPGGGVKSILNNISFCIGKGLTFGITGESGSGKTTLAKIIAGHLKPTGGRIILNITPLNKANPVQLLFQNTGNILNPLRKVFEVVSEAAYVSTDNERSAAEQRAEQLLNRIGINHELWNRRGL